MFLGSHLCRSGRASIMTYLLLKESHNWLFAAVALKTGSGRLGCCTARVCHLPVQKIWLG